MPPNEPKILNRFDITKRLVALLNHEEAVVGGIGNTNFDLWAAGRRPQNFYMLGSMGLAIPIALGVALAQPKRKVVALEGDGSLLMQLGALTTVATLPGYTRGMAIIGSLAFVGLSKIRESAVFGGVPVGADGKALK